MEPKTFPIDLSLSLLFRCPSCEQGTCARAFPYCATCAALLEPCPALCPSCASPLCPTDPGGACLRPWVGVSNPALQSFSGQYLLLGPGYSVLKSWKVRHGWLANRVVLRGPPRLGALLPPGAPAFIVPVPQRLRRAWRLGGSPARVIADWLSRWSRIPVLEALQPAERPQGARRQGELCGPERLANRLAFASTPGLRLPPEAQLILVDDFLTTGHTLRSAAAALRSSQEPGVGDTISIHAFALGARPIRASTAQDPIPKSSATCSIAREGP
jgi:predicted amidophosphoribosyltransferase